RVVVHAGVGGAGLDEDERIPVRLEERVADSAVVNHDAEQTFRAREAAFVHNSTVAGARRMPNEPFYSGPMLRRFALGCVALAALASSACRLDAIVTVVVRPDGS